ncbi:MAG: glycoside hydrolase family 3 protein [Desulfomicrobium sp.]|nr:glycoside hydrolase family 3 protein [Pseudomonadota bacterium]MBV1712107.1 glycoside hydrolase family 3 protein [Desulfomicrobium sp.]MBU4572745.1 glycoside hydrolase family 3 protein [Pseudomonadota bacterium]MBU4594740.1 glycoside hydrolase family 3 protein [Pseudomonadota bacterium]MBV1718621.1 glycoside hydrolase family 3 protein [Desulfomicrobium sp.]
MTPFGFGNLILSGLVFLVLLPAPVLAADQAPVREMIGQMLLVGFRGTSVGSDAPILRDIREHNLGGVILFDRDVQLQSSERNIQSPEQVKALTASLQANARTPLFIAVDQEGGKVRRFREDRGFAFSPSAKSMGLGAPAQTRLEGERTGKLLADLGVNLNFAPVVDVDVNPASPAIGKLERSFSSDPDLVALHAGAFCQGLLSQGVLPCLKHFPGHGSAAVDSHLGLTDVSKTWTPAELRPYEMLIPLGASPLIMTGHLFLRQFDDVHPSTLSRAVLTGLLRQRLGFGGVIVSDDMQMRAIADHYGQAEAILLAVEAGVDMLVFGNNLDYDPDIVPKAVNILAKAVQEGRLSRERIEASHERILAAKQRLYTRFALVR